MSSASYVRQATPGSSLPGPEEHDLWARHLLVRFLQGLFNKLPPEQDWHWEPDLATTKISITGGTPLDYGKVSPRPAIAIDVGQYRTANIALDQLRAASLMTGDRLHVDLVPGTAVIYAVAKVPDEARRLGGWIMRQIRYHRRVLQKVGGFHEIGQHLAVSPPSTPGAVLRGSADSEAHLVTVTVPWHMQWGWRASPVAQTSQTSLDYFLKEDRASDYDRPPLNRMRDSVASITVDDEPLQDSGMKSGPEPLDQE